MRARLQVREQPTETRCPHLEPRCAVSPRHDPAVRSDPEPPRQPAVAFYLWRKREGAYLSLTIDVLRVTGGAITGIVTFHDDSRRVMPVVEDR
ncbi:MULTISPECIES: hypothetical protein [Streptosporangium]|uniref:Uncharacterized protein n=1 Tax=Streptosporangium brasiliense TaxID=47480 RepID=A0ABT9RLD3_9ACTN|nr:hypothetical protein [Streptosporangium brasiliense]MDP9869903.1 hypothetical protein [Streptosporangium brasiliense]